MKHWWGIIVKLQYPPSSRQGMLLSYQKDTKTRKLWGLKALSPLWLKFQQLVCASVLCLYTVVYTQSMALASKNIFLWNIFRLLGVAF